MKIYEIILMRSDTELSMIFALLSGMAHFLFAFDMVEKEDSCEL